MKKFISILLCAALLATSLALNVFSAGDQRKLQFNSDGTFKILNISDIQDTDKLMGITADFIKAAIESEKPDLIVLTGDNVAGHETLSADKTEKGIRAYMDILESCKIPVAIVFGNHDEYNSGLTKEQQMAIYNSYSVSVSIDEGDSLWGCGTYNLPIYSSQDSNKVIFNCWFFDSGARDENGDYDHVKQDQLDWYKKTANELKAQNGGMSVPSLAFQHIIVPEIYDALEEVKMTTPGNVAQNGKYYILPETAEPGSVLGESPCPSGTNGGEFEAMLAQGDVLGIVTGHDHCNSFVVPYKGIDLINTATCGFKSYGSNDSRSIRVFTLNEASPSIYSTYTVSYDDYYSNDAMKMIEYNFYGFVGELYSFFYSLWTRITNLF